MRLTPEEQSIIKATIRKHFGAETIVLLFGSRTNDRSKGGDIDLFIETELDADTLVERKIRCLAELKHQLGDQKIDLVVKRNSAPPSLPIFEHAQSTGVRL
ncbi:MAG: nucleotidyltransferase family protein [Saccharospirillum sp.]